MTSSNIETTKASEPTLGQDLRYFLGYWLRDRRVLIAIALVALVAGAALNWSWFVALGIAPIVLAMAPCGVMCAIGLCKMGKGKGEAACGKSAAGDEASDGKALTSGSQATKRIEASGSE